MEVTAVKTTKTPEQLRIIHQERFQKASFLDIPKILDNKLRL